jgi:RNA polymerase sigma-70 factor (ECF subfamily)
MMGNGTLQGRRPERSAAFLELIAGVDAPLRGFIRQRIGMAHLAVDDVLQKTFLNAWAHADFDPARADARSFLFTIAGNLVTDWLRSDGSKSLSLDELSARGSLVPSMVDCRSRDPLARMIAAETAEILRAALARICADHQEVLERFYFRQEGTQFEIATAMGLSVAAFNSRLNRARLELKRMLLTFHDHGPLNRARADLERILPTLAEGGE